MYLPLVLKSEDIRESVNKSGGESDFATVLVGVIFSAILFGLLCREMEEVWHADFYLVAGSADLLVWIGFGFDNLLEAILFDVLSIYELNFADISPESFWTKFLLITFRILIDIVILQGLFTIWSVIRENRLEEGSVPLPHNNKGLKSWNTLSFSWVCFWQRLPLQHSCSIYLKQSSILAYLLVGIVAWYIGIEINENVIDVLSETGIILLLFMAGLEVNIQSFLKNWKRVLTVGLGQITLNAVLGIMIGWLVLDIEKIETLVFFGLCLTFSSTIVVMGYLRAKREMESIHGQLILGIMVLQDIVAVLALAVLKGVKETSDAGVAATGDGGLPMIFLWLIVKLLVLGFILYLAANFLLKPLFRRFATSSEMLLIGTLGWALGIAALGEGIHFSPEIAAFMAGAALTVLPYKLEMEDKVDSLKSFGIIFFFITVGYELHPSASMLSQWPGISASLALAVFGTVFMGLFLGYVTRLKGRTSFMIGGVINQISEFSLILATLARGAGIFSDSIYVTVALASVLSIFISSFWLPKLADMYVWIAPYLKFLDERSVNKDLDKEVSSELSDHVILLGYNALSKTIAEHLQSAGLPMMVIDLDPDTIGLIEEEGHELVNGLYADIY